MEAYQKYHPQGVKFIGLTAEGESSLAQTKSYISELGILWRTGYGASPTINALGVRYLPTKLVVGPDGRIAWHDALGGSLDAAIEAALAKAAS